ncbi:MAG: CPBP family intramembrane metalloprotease [Defluviitaleaceae bacterium]|nr:CPBP family intramembrane metalloprotease [Defluviitaleaceae bacterium]
MTKEMQNKIITMVVLNIALLAIISYFMLGHRVWIAPHLPPAVNDFMGLIGWWFFLPIPTILLMVRDKERPRDIGFTMEKLPKQILLGIALAVPLLAVFAIGVPGLFGLVEWHWGGADQLNIGWIFASLAYNLLIVGLFEEVIYRGHMFKKLQDIHAAPWFAILITSVSFGALHIPSYVIRGDPMFPGEVSGWFYVLFATAIGAAFGLCRAKGATLITLIVSHAVYNVVFTTVLAYMYY